MRGRGITFGCSSPSHKPNKIPQAQVNTRMFFHLFFFQKPPNGRVNLNTTPRRKISQPPVFYILEGGHKKTARGSEPLEIVTWLGKRNLIHHSRRVGLYGAKTQWLNTYRLQSFGKIITALLRCTSVTLPMNVVPLGKGMWFVCNFWEAPDSHRPLRILHVLCIARKVLKKINKASI